MADDFEDGQKPPHPFDYVSRDVIQDLWGLGYTLVRRTGGDPFHIRPEMVPNTRAYQWMHLIHDKGMLESGWAAVPASRHDGYFMPFGTVGPIEVSGLGLFEKPGFEVEAERFAAQRAAQQQQQITDWKGKTAEQGFSGSFSVGDQTGLVGDPALATAIDSEAKTINTLVGVSPEMMPYLSRIMKERDRLYEEMIAIWGDQSKTFTAMQQRIFDQYQAQLERDPRTLKGPTLNALLLPIAIEEIRRTVFQRSPVG